MKLLNFSNSMFKWEEEKRLHFYGYLIDIAYKFKYTFSYPASSYIGFNQNIKQIKKYYRNWFINDFKELKEVITNETSKFR